MHQSLARYSAPVSLVHAPSWADFITTMVGFKVFGTDNRLHRQPCNAGEDTLAFRFAFAKPDASERGISEHAIWNQPIAGGAISTCEIVTYDSKIVFGYVRELWTAGAFPDGPYIWRTCLQSAIDANVTAPVQFNVGLLQSNSGGIWNAPNRDQDVAAVNVLLTPGGAHGNR